MTRRDSGTAIPASSPRIVGGDAGRALEFAVGLLVLVALAVLLAVALLGNDRSAQTGYTLSARFQHIDGLGIGSEVKLAGVSVGQVTAERVDPRTYQAVVSFTVADGIKLPDDSSAVITSDSLLGGKYLALSPGGSDTLLKPGGQVGITQGSISLEQLLSKFIFSVTDAMSAKKTGAASSSTDDGSALAPDAASTPAATAPPATAPPAAGTAPTAPSAAEPSPVTPSPVAPSPVAPAPVTPSPAAPAGPKP